MSRTALHCPSCDAPVPPRVETNRAPAVERYTCSACGRMTLRSELVHRRELRVVSGGRPMAAGSTTLNPVTDLFVGNLGSTFIVLGCTSVGDSDAGFPVFYDTRYVQGATFVEGQWAGAAVGATEEPASHSGVVEQLDGVPGGLTPNTQYSIAIKRYDHYGNTSPMSNILTFTTNP